MVKLVCKKVLFYSKYDESLFFEWISKVRCIMRWEGESDEIHLYIPKKNISKACLRELTALFYRYKIDMRQLGQFLNDTNRQWYMNKEAFWFKKVFEDSENTKMND